MTFLSNTLIKIFLILFVSSYIAIAGPVAVGNDLSVVGRELASGGSVSIPRQAAGGDFLLSEGDFLGRSGDDGHAEKAADIKKQESHIKGVGGSTLAGMRHKQGDTAESAGAFVEPPQGGQGGSVNGEGDSLLSLFSGNAGDGGGDRVSGLSILDILRKRNL